MSSTRVGELHTATITQYEKQKIGWSSKNGDLNNKSVHSLAICSRVEHPVARSAIKTVATTEPST